MAAKKKAAKKLKAVGGAKVRKGQCERGRELILQGKTNQQVWDVVKKEFPGSRLGVSGAGWLRNELRKTNKRVKTNRELNTSRGVSKKKAA